MWMRQIQRVNLTGLQKPFIIQMIFGFYPPPTQTLIYFVLVVLLPTLSINFVSCAPGDKDVGENTDGHNYISMAKENGAIAAVIEKELEDKMNIRKKWRNRGFKSKTPSPETVSASAPVRWTF